MIDHARAALAHVLSEQGVTSPEAFRQRYGVYPRSLSAAAALTIVTWMAHAGSTPVVWVPRAIRDYAAMHGITQDAGESDHTFTERLRAVINEAQTP